MVDFAKANWVNARRKEIDRLIAKYGTGRAGHSLFSPSSSAGWLNCKGFLLANATKDDMAGVDAAYGTVAHGIAAAWLTAIRDEGREAAEHVPERFLGFEMVENGFRIVCDADMLHHIRRYIDWCEEVEIEGDVYIERHIFYSEYMPIPEQGGTADHFVAKHKRLIVTDLKMGIGVPVFVEWNTQALLYALGVYLEWNWIYSFETICIRICQPRLDYFGTWEISVPKLLEWAETVVRPAADAAWHEDAPRSPSPKACQWCNDVGCAARSALLEDLADDAFDDTEAPEFSQEELDTHAMSPLFGKLSEDKEPRFNRRMETSLMAWRYHHRKMFERYFREIGEELMHRALKGEFIPGWKIVDGRRSFTWCDDDYAAEQLSYAGLKESQIFRTEVTSVNEAKKMLRAAGKKPKEIAALFNHIPDNDPDALPLVVTKPGKPTLVSAEDDRTDIGDEADDSFDAAEDAAYGLDDDQL